MRIGVTQPGTLRLARTRPLLLLGLLPGVGALLLVMTSGIAFGAADIAPADVFAALAARAAHRSSGLGWRRDGRGRGAHAGADAQPAGRPRHPRDQRRAGLVAATLLIVVPDVPSVIVPVAAFGGALLVAALIYLLAWRNRQRGHHTDDHLRRDRRCPARADLADG